MSLTYGVNKTSNVQYLAFSTYVSPTCNGQVNCVSFSSFLDSLCPFITKPYYFHLQISCTFFFHRTTTKSFISKSIFFGVPFILHCSYKYMQKAGLVSSFPCSLIFGCFRPMSLHDSWKTGQDTFPFSFSVTLYKFFISMLNHKKHMGFNKQTVFFFFVNQPKYIHILCSGKMVAKNDWICTYLEIKWCCLVYR